MKKQQAALSSTFTWSVINVNVFFSITKATIRLILFPSLIQEQVVSPPEPEPTPTPPPEPEPITASLPAPEEADLSWEDKEDKLDAENIPPDSPQTNGDKKYQYKEGVCLNLDSSQLTHCASPFVQLVFNYFPYDYYSSLLVIL